MKPLPNLATHDVAAAHSFGYMHASSRHDHVVKLCWPEGDHTTLSPVGPSPVIISLANLQKVAQTSLDCFFASPFEGAAASFASRPGARAPGDWASLLRLRRSRRLAAEALPALASASDC